jgi:hypothetical protein
MTIVRPILLFAKVAQSPSFANSSAVFAQKMSALLDMEEKSHAFSKTTLMHRHCKMKSSLSTQELIPVFV